MGAGTLAVLAAVVVVATINFRTMRRVWASAAFYRPQKIGRWGDGIGRLLFLQQLEPIILLQDASRFKKQLGVAPLEYLHSGACRWRATC